MPFLKLISTFILFILVLPNCVASDSRTVTLYFAGTGATVDWWNGNKAVFDFGLHGFWRPELLATLHHAQLTQTHRQDKKFINGIGTGQNPLIDLLGKTRPSHSILKIRGWQTCLDEATDFINEVIENHDQEIILNLVGWSRGAVLAMLVAKQLSDQTQIRDINIIAIDPVSGDKNINENIFYLSKKVKRFVGLYAEDERSRYFTPIIPAFNPNNTRAWLVRIPGSHETLVGNIQIDGHALEPNCLYPDCLIEKYIPALQNNVGFVKLIIGQLLTSRAWGSVQFNDQQLKIIVTPEMSADNIKALWQFDYSFMRKISFIPIPLTFLWDLDFYTKKQTCESVNNLRGIKLADKNVPRCAKRYFIDKTSRISSLTEYSEIEKLSWKNMQLMTKHLQQQIDF